jgi:hypothetical protein
VTHAISAPGVRPVGLTRAALDTVAWRLLIASAAVAVSSLGVIGPDGRFGLSVLTMIKVVDALLLAIGLAQLPGIWADAKQVISAKSFAAHSVELCFGLFVVWVAVAWAANPRDNGLYLTLRLVGVGGVIRVLRTSDLSRLQILTRVLVGAVCVQAIVCIAQLVVNRSVGLYAFGEFDDPFLRTAGWRAPTGLSVYPYILAAAALLAVAMLIVVPQVGLLWSIAGAAASGVLVGISGSISAMVSVGALTVAVLVKQVSHHRDANVWRTFAVFVVALVGSGLMQQSVWTWKADRSTAVEGGKATSGRAGQLRVALELTKRSPVVGVGPGQFVTYRLAHPELDRITPDRQITHSVPALVMAEAGVIAPLLLLGTVLAACRRRITVALPLFAAMSGYVLADFFHWYGGNGLLQWGIAIGVTGALATRAGST